LEENSQAFLVGVLESVNVKVPFEAVYLKDKKSFMTK